MRPDRRSLLAASLAATVTVPAFAATPAERVFTPEEFGAKGDGRTNDSAAMARLSTAVTLHGGGIVAFRPTTYLVGAQGLGTGFYLFPPRDLLVFRRCRLPLRLRGNGARLLCEPGLRYGVFGTDGQPKQHAMPYLGPGLASPYAAMILIERCLADIDISDLELAGCTDQLVIGGQYGDTGWQIPATGLVLRENLGAEVIARVRSHDHPLDGITIDGIDADTPAIRSLTDIVADRNGRQGLSVVGGRGYRFTRCRFTRTGRGKVRSAPGAGVDIEAEAGKRIRNLAFADCRFADNSGCGMVADTGDSEGVRFVRCRFVGTTNWSAWAGKPRFRFDGCHFTGAATRAHGDADPARAAHFTGCRFDDDPAASPTRKVYGGTNRDHPLLDLSDARNVLFDRCRFVAAHDAALPWSTGAIYRDCTMVQTTPNPGYPRGRFEGRNTVQGKVDLYASRITGTLLVNGAPVR